MIRWCVQNFKSIWCDMASSQSNKDTKEIAFEGCRGGILESMKNHQDISWQIKVGFRIKEDCFAHLCKVSSDFARIWKLSKIQAEKKVVKCYNHRSTLGTSLQWIITCSNFVLSTTGSDSVMCSKFQINLMWYAGFPNEERYQRDSPESYKGEILESLQNH